LWTWDARPYPAFPALLDAWSDGPNWEAGHWLTGRLGSVPLDALVAAILADSGIAGCDASGLADSVDGYLVDRPMPPRAMLDPLALAYGFDAAEDGETLVFRPRGGLPIAELTEDDLVLPDNAPPVRLVRAQETELPREVSLGFTDVNAEYRRSAVTSRRLVVGATRASRAELAVVTHDAAAERRADIWLQDLWAGREAVGFAVPPSRLALAAGDVIGLTANGRRRLIEVNEIVDTESRRIEARAIDPEIFNLPLALPRRQPPRLPVVLGPAHVLVLDLPTLPSAPADVLTWLAVFADPWPGPMVVWRSADGSSFERLAIVEAPAVVGETLDDLPAGPLWRWDRVSRVRVKLYGGALASAADLAVLNGRNAAAVRNADGEWEVLQFGEAELVDVDTYQLSRLLRGQGGSEEAMVPALAAGAQFVLLDPQVLPLAHGLGDLGRPVTLRVVAGDRDHGDASAAEIAVTPQATALKPLAPVHLRGVRTGAGVEISWVRRTRIDGDSWDAGEVPVGEESEAYDVDILSGVTVLRTLTADMPGVLYPSANEIADFGSPQSTLSIAVAQRSTVVGRGFAATATLSF
jgi:Putative phage tail protein